MVTIILTTTEDLFVVPIMLVFLPMIEAEAGTLVVNFPAEHGKWALTENYYRGDLTATSLVRRGDSNSSPGGEIQW